MKTRLFTSAIILAASFLLTPLTAEARSNYNGFNAGISDQVSYSAKTKHKSKKGKKAKKKKSASTSSKKKKTVGKHTKKSGRNRGVASDLPAKKNGRHKASKYLKKHNAEEGY